MNPIDYTLDVANPMALALQGYQLGSDQRMAREAAVTQREQFGQQMQMDQQRIGLQERQVGLQEQTFAANQSALQQQQAAAQAMQADLQGLSQMVAAGTATAEDFAGVATRNPDLASGLKSSFDMLSGEKQRTSLLNMGQIYSVLKSGNIDLAKSMLEERVTAAENSGNAEELATAKAALGIIDIDPNAAAATLGLGLQVLGGGKFDALLGGVEEPAAIQALRIRALEAGLAPGSEEYRNFMLKGGTDKGMALEVGADGTVRMTQGDVGDDPFGGKPPTEGQLSGAGFLQRMRGAEDIFSALAEKGVVSIPIGASLAVGTRAEAYALNSEQQQLLQAQRDWVRSKLRKESGAVIGPDEMADEIITYFPQPGEGPEVVEQKRLARLRADRQIEITSGPAAGMADEQEPESSVNAFLIEMQAKRDRGEPFTPEERQRIQSIAGD